MEIDKEQKNISIIIIAGFFVAYFDSMWPDIIIGLGTGIVSLFTAIVFDY